MNKSKRFPKNVKEKKYSPLFVEKNSLNFSIHINGEPASLHLSFFFCIKPQAKTYMKCTREQRKWPNIDTKMLYLPTHRSDCGLEKGTNIFRNFEGNLF